MSNAPNSVKVSTLSGTKESHPMNHVQSGLGSAGARRLSSVTSWPRRLLIGHLPPILASDWPWPVSPWHHWVSASSRMSTAAFIKHPAALQSSFLQHSQLNCWSKKIISCEERAYDLGERFRWLWDDSFFVQLSMRHKLSLKSVSMLSNECSAHLGESGLYCIVAIPISLVSRQLDLKSIGSSPEFNWFIPEFQRDPTFF